MITPKELGIFYLETPRFLTTWQSDRIQAGRFKGQDPSDLKKGLSVDKDFLT